MFSLALSIAAWPALTELIAPDGVRPPKAHTDMARLPTTTRRAMSAIAARRCVSRREARGVTRR
jgi:hypothetical protein